MRVALKTISILAALAVAGAWYLVDGRYSYFYPSGAAGKAFRVDRLTGQSFYCGGVDGCVPLMTEWKER